MPVQIPDSPLLAEHLYAVKPEKPRAGQESVWDYPRPPRLERSQKMVQVVFAGQLIAQSSGAYRLLETSHPPGWYIPPEDVRKEFLFPTEKNSFCEWKGLAVYWTVKVGGQPVENGAWSYESPSPAFATIKGFLAFYPSLFECYVADERVEPQPGRFYGGWITSDIVGPFKGGPGSQGW